MENNSEFRDTIIKYFHTDKRYNKYLKDKIVELYLLEKGKSKEDIDIAFAQYNIYPNRVIIEAKFNKFFNDILFLKTKELNIIIIQNQEGKVLKIY